MNKKVLAIVLVIIILLGGGYFFWQSNSTAGNTQGGTLEITHELGTVKVPRNPQNIVVFDYGTLDILDSLDVKVTGVAKSNLPTYLERFNASNFIDIGTLFEPNYEELAKVKPDIIFISGRQKEAYSALSEIAPTVYLTIDTNDYFGSFRSNVETVANITGKEKEAKAALTKVDKELADLQKLTAEKNPTGLILMTNQGKISAYGASSRFGIIHNAFGVKTVDDNIETTTHGQSINYEYIVEKNPQYIFVIDRNKVIGGEAGTDMFENDLMRNTTAYKEKHIIFLDQEAWYLSSGGIKSTEKMIAEITDALK